MKKADNPELAICAIDPRRLTETLGNGRGFRPVPRGEIRIEIKVNVPLYDEASKTELSIRLQEGIVQERIKKGRGFKQTASWQLTADTADLGEQFVSVVAAFLEYRFRLLEERLGGLPILQPGESITLGKQGFPFILLCDCVVADKNECSTNCQTP